MSMPIEWLERLTSHASKQNIYFLASAFDEVMVDVLESCGILAHKIASPELNHLPLIRHMSRQGKPILISTGMSRLGEIEEALEAVVQTENTSIALLHCISSYPTPPEDCNLRIIPMLKQAFQLSVGLSDHTLDPYQAPRFAVALGANLLEKHFTLNRQLTGPDHPFAIEPAELCEMVQIIRKTENLSTEEKETLLQTPIAETYLGSSSKKIAPSEAKLAASDRRSIMVIRRMRSGDRITPDTIRILRAEQNLTPGLAPQFWDIVIGRRVIRDIPSGRGILWDDLLS
jgi:N-acetylneuraminate synthase